MLTVVLMMAGFALLSFIRAALASLFVQEDEAPFDLRDEGVDLELLRTVEDLPDRPSSIERRLERLQDDGVAIGSPARRTP